MIPDAENASEVFVVVPRICRMVERMEPGGNEYFAQRTETPGDTTVHRSCYEVSRQVEGKPSHRRCPKQQKRNKSYGVGKEEIYRMEAGGGGKVQLLLRMMRGVESPDETPFVLKPVSPVEDKVVYYKPGNSLHDGMETMCEAERQEGELGAQEAE